MPAEHKDRPEENSGEQIFAPRDAPTELKRYLVDALYYKMIHGNITDPVRQRMVALQIDPYHLRIFRMQTDYQILFRRNDRDLNEDIELKAEILNARRQFQDVLTNVYEQIMELPIDGIELLRKWAIDVDLPPKADSALSGSWVLLKEHKLLSYLDHSASLSETSTRQVAATIEDATNNALVEESSLHCNPADPWNVTQSLKMGSMFCMFASEMRREFPDLQIDIEVPSGFSRPSKSELREAKILSYISGENGFGEYDILSMQQYIQQLYDEYNPVEIAIVLEAVNDDEHDDYYAGTEEWEEERGDEENPYEEECEDSPWSSERLGITFQEQSSTSLRVTAYYKFA